MSFTMKNPQPTKTFAIASKIERTEFIGTYVRPEMKEHLKKLARKAPGGTRNYSWAINQILEAHLAANPIKETDNNDNETE